MEMNPLAQIEEIKKLKARYFRLMDQKKWDQWADLFTEDATWQGGTSKTSGRQQIVQRISSTLVNTTSIHHGHMPEIELTSETTATGIWPMFDYLVRPINSLKGYGHYEEEYVKEEDGKWRIKNLKLTRLHIDYLTPDTERKETPSP